MGGLAALLQSKHINQISWKKTLYVFKLNFSCMHQLVNGYLWGKRNIITVIAVKYIPSGELVKKCTNVNAGRILMPRRWGKVTLALVNVAFVGCSEGRSLMSLSEGCNTAGLGSWTRHWCVGTSCCLVPLCGKRFCWREAVGCFQKGDIHCHSALVMGLWGRWCQCWNLSALSASLPVLRL